MCLGNSTEKCANSNEDFFNSKHLKCEMTRIEFISVVTDLDFPKPLLSFSFINHVNVCAKIGKTTQQEALMQFP